MCLCLLRLLPTKFEMERVKMSSKYQKVVNKIQKAAEGGKLDADKIKELRSKIEKAERQSKRKD